MTEPDPDLSNGTCYYQSGFEAHSRYIPCGNEALGHKSCCESLDMCLSSHACYNGQYGVTYLAGCTDPDYLDSSCPDKGAFGDQQWAGLVYCNGTSNEWTACEDGGSTVTTPSPCWCPETSRTVAFTDASRLTDIMSLPASLGATVIWKDVNAYESEHSLTSPPTASESSSPTTLSSTFSATTESSVAPSGLPTPTSSLNTSTLFPTTAATATGSSGLSTGQKIGVALGSAGGAVAILLLAWLASRLYFGRQTKDSQAPQVDAPTTIHTPRPQSESVQFEDPEIRSPAWSGHKSELPANNEGDGMLSPANTTRTLQRPESVEVGGSYVGSAHLSPTRPGQDGGLQLPGHLGTYYEMAG